MDTTLVNVDPLLHMALIGAVLAALPLTWLMVRGGPKSFDARLDALALLTLFLTFDLVLFGAFTRLTDSGLGCPDWPGCYGEASPLAAREAIAAAQSALPTGPVTHAKAWIEMLHRYLATAVGTLIVALTVGRWIRWSAARRARGAASAAPAWWATATLVWVCLQGAFGAFTVTFKLYPAIVTAHLLGGLVLLALLAVQAWRSAAATIEISAGLRRGTALAAVLVGLQIALGGWVSTNYAVLACGDFPTCHGQWWPAADFGNGFDIIRPLGVGRDGGWLPFEALVAIHLAHRLGAVLVVVALGSLIGCLARVPSARPMAAVLAAILVWQAATGISNVAFDWPLLAAVGHTGGAAAMVLWFSRFLIQARSASVQRAASSVGGVMLGA